ncbi:hypothetical protein BDAP_002129 [Binucleata daphniae]
MSGIENTERKYNIKDKKNGVNNGNQQIGNKNEKTVDSSTNEAVETESTRQKRHTNCECRDDQDYTPIKPVKKIQNRATNAAYASKVVDYINIKGDFYFNVYSLQYFQKFVIQLFQETLDKSNHIINKLSRINRIIRQFYNKQITYMIFHEQYIEIISRVNNKLKDIEDLVKNKAMEMVFLYDNMQKYEQKITKNVETDNSIENLTKDIMKIGYDMKKLLSDFIILHANLNLKYENEINKYTFELIRLENSKLNTDETMINYNKYLSTVTYEITKFYVEKDKLYYNLGLLQNCMKKKDNIISDLNRLEVMYCQKTQENDKLDSTFKDTIKKDICDIDNQQSTQNVLHAIIEQDLFELQKNVVTNMNVQVAELKQCNGEECEETEAKGVSANEKADHNPLCDMKTD